MRSWITPPALPPHWLRSQAVSIWIPGPPQLGRDRESRRDYWRLVRSWCGEEQFPIGVTVELTVYTVGTPPTLPRLQRIIETAAQVEVVRTSVVSDGRQGVRIVAIGPGTRLVQLQLGLLEAPGASVRSRKR
jgi:hypothetical protein